MLADAASAYCPLSSAYNSSVTALRTTPDTHVNRPTKAPIPARAPPASNTVPSPFRLQAGRRDVPAEEHHILDRFARAVSPLGEDIAGVHHLRYMKSGVEDS
jgi:hypothetical protein